MKLRSVIFLLSLCWGFTAGQAAPRTFHGGGVSFTYDDSILQKPKVRHEAAVPDGDASDKIDGVGPAHWAVDFADYRAYLWVLPTTDPAVKDFRKTYPKSAQGLRDLRALLKKRPVNPKEAPVLPFPDVGVVFITKVQYLDFRNGSGMAWLSQWLYEPNPINNEELWYVFQGLTKDEKYYVSVEVRMKHPSLPEKADTDTRRSQEFAKTYDAYLRKAVPALAKLPDETFQPSLTKLRAMFESIEVTPAP